MLSVDPVDNLLWATHEVSTLNFAVVYLEDLASYFD